jgi:WD40 repeat protein
MAGLILVRRLVVGLLVLLSGVAARAQEFPNAPVVIEVAEHAWIQTIAFAPRGDRLMVFRDGELSIWRTRPSAKEERLVKRIELALSRQWLMNAAPIAVSPNGKLVAIPVDGLGTRGISKSNAIQVLDITKDFAKGGADDVGAAEKEDAKEDDEKDKEDADEGGAKKPAGGAVIGTLIGGSESASHGYFTFSPKGDELYVAIEHSIEAWSPTTDKRRTIALGKTNEGTAVQHMRVLADGSLLTARADGRICLWDVEKPELKSFRQVASSIYRVGPGGRGGSIRMHHVVTSPDGKRAAVIDYANPAVMRGGALYIDGTAYVLSIWDLEKGKVLRKPPLGKGKRGVGSVAWSPDGMYLAWDSHGMWAFGDDRADDDRDIVVWDVTKHKALFRAKPPEGVAVADGIAFSPDGKMLAVPAQKKPRRGLVLLYDLQDSTKPPEPDSEAEQ